MFRGHGTSLSFAAPVPFMQMITPAFVAPLPMP
jgi:hypothetical protein